MQLRLSHDDRGWHGRTGKEDKVQAFLVNLDCNDRPYQDRVEGDVVFRLSLSQQPDHHPISVNGGRNGTGGIQHDGAA